MTQKETRPFFLWFSTGLERVTPLMFLVGGQAFLLYNRKDFRDYPEWEIGLHLFLTGIEVLLFVKSYKHWKSLR
jgi:hypothetical protein